MESAFFLKVIKAVEPDELIFTTPLIDDFIESLSDDFIIVDHLSEINFIRILLHEILFET